MVLSTWRELPGSEFRAGVCVCGVSKWPIDGNWGEVGREIEIAAATTFMTNLMLNCARKEGGRERKNE